MLFQLIPLEKDYYYGSTFLSLAIMPIPRMWWPDKPAPTVTTLLADYFGFFSSNFAVSLIGEAYANFSWPGVMIMFALFGLISAKIYVQALRGRDDTERWVTLGLYSTYVLLVIRGSFHSMTSYYLFVVMWFPVTLFAARFLRRLPWGHRRHSSS